jgi:hypothetical protein
MEVIKAFCSSKKGQKFSTNRFVGNFLQLTYKSDMCALSIREYIIYYFYFLLMLLKKTCEKHILLK